MMIFDFWSSSYSSTAASTLLSTGNQTLRKMWLMESSCLTTSPVTAWFFLMSFPPKQQQILYLAKNVYTVWWKQRNGLFYRWLSLNWGVVKERVIEGVLFVCFFFLLWLLFQLLSDFLDFAKLMLHSSTVSHCTSELAFVTFLSPIYQKNIW